MIVPNTQSHHHRTWGAIQLGQLIDVTGLQCHAYNYVCYVIRLHRSARCAYACPRHCRPCYHRRCQTGPSGAGAFAFSAALSAPWPVQMHTSAAACIWAMIRWTCTCAREGTSAAMTDQCLLFSCCSESIEGPVYESPQGCHALNKPNLRADSCRQKTSIHALNKLQPTRPPS